MASLFTYLTDIPFLSSLSDADAEFLSAGAYRRTVPRHAVVQLEGQPATAFTVLTSGLAKAVLLSEDGRELHLEFFKPGDSSGEMNLFGLKEYAYSIVTAKKSEFIFFAIDVVAGLIRRDQDFALRTLALVTQKLFNIQNRFRDVVYERGRGRILKYFECLAAQNGAHEAAGVLIPGDLSHQAIADACGLARESVSRQLHKLERSGTLSRTNKGWLLSDTRPRGSDELGRMTNAT